MAIKLKNNFPLISVIIAVYNGEKYLDQTIKSVVNQTYSNFELIIIDGGSKDGTLEIIKTNSKSISYWISEPDKGIYSAWNKAIPKAKGEWLCFIGCDDIFLPSALNAYVRHINDNNLFEYEFISSVIQLVKNDLVPKRFFGKRWIWNSHKLEMRVAHVGALHHKSLFDSYGLFDESYKIAGDYELLLRPKENLKASFLEELTVLMRCEGVSNSNLKVFEETLKAKIYTAGRNKFICMIEYFYMLFKFYMLKMFRP